MPYDRSVPLSVQTEATGKAPTAWAWAIYRGAERFLILRSRPKYVNRADALEAGLRAAADVGRRLGAEVVLEQDELADLEPA